MPDTRPTTPATEAGRAAFLDGLERKHILAIEAEAYGKGWADRADEFSDEDGEAASPAALDPTPVAGEPHDRSTYLLLTDFERVEEWCRGIRMLFRQPPYMVGSALTRSDYRDIDLRLILADCLFDRMFRGDPVRVRLANRALSTWGQRETGLPIDFQIQRQSAANEKYPNERRNPMGVRDWSVIVPDAIAALAHPEEERSGE